MIKRILTGIFLLFLTASLFAAGEIQVSISPKVITEGATVDLILTSSDGSAPRLQEFPEIPGIRWIRGSTATRSSMQIINGKTTRSTQTIYQFIPLEVKTFTIPELKITTGRNSIRTEPFTLEVRGAKVAVPGRTSVPASGSASGARQPQKERELALDEAFYATMSLLTTRRDFYLGEEIPVEIKVYQLPSLQVKMGYPKIEANDKANIVFRNFSSVNRENSNFDAVTRAREDIDGIPFNVYSFRTAFRAISPGAVSLRAEIPAAVVTSTRHSSLFDDDFFSMGLTPQNTQEKTLFAKCAGTVQIRPLPGGTADVPFLGLVGNWDVRMTLSKAPHRVGSPVTLNIHVSGSGSLESLTAPALELPGFRVYPPEVEKSDNSSSADLRYILIPLKPGETEVRAQVCTFNTASGTYQSTSLAERLDIEQASGILPSTSRQVVVGGTLSGAEPDRTADNTSAPAPRMDEILYLHKDLSHTVALPLNRNAILTSVLLVVAGLGFYLFTVILKIRRQALEKDPAIRRRMAARARRAGILAKMKESEPEELSDRVGLELTEYFNDMLNLPPGTALSEAADHVQTNRPELAELLRKIARTSWMPDLKYEFNADFKTKLIHAFAKFSVILLVLGMGVTGLNAGEPVKPASAPESSETAMTAYDSGNFQSALKFYAGHLDTTNVSPAALYNMGNCFYRLGDYARASVCYERALRLDPRNSDILENLNLTRRKLMLGERYLIESPADALPYLRDTMRPDEWLRTMAFGIFLLFLALGLRTLNVNGAIWKTLAAAALLIVVIGGTAVHFQYETSYSGKPAIVTVRNAPLYSLPSEQSGVLKLKLKAGQEVSIEEKRLNWVRIRVDSTEGWMHSGDLEQLWK